MNKTPLETREDRFTAANEYRDKVGQAHFPTDKLGAGELDRATKKRGRK